MVEDNRYAQNRSYWLYTWRIYRKNTFAMVGLVALLVMALAAIFAPYIVPHNPFQMISWEDSPPQRWQAPSSRHLLGTDSIGRDVFSRLLYGGRVSLLVGIVATIITISIGILIGSLAGYFGGWIDSVLMRFTDTVICFPVLFLLIAISTMLRPSMTNVMLVIGLAFWTRTARIVRGEFLKLRSMEFVQAAIAVGVPARRVIMTHLIPNAMSPMIVDTTLRVAYAVLMEATLSFLGIGVQEPIPSWGRMLHQATSLSVLDGMPWLWIPPGIAILILVLSINFVGDGIRDAVDPKLRGHIF